MRFWRIFCTLLSAIRLMDILSGKEVIATSGAILGVVVDIKLDLRLGRILAIVENEGSFHMIPSEQISGMTDEVLLFEGPPTA
jgi:sporulation protein YlmC with PRC-barrel domain